MHINLWPDMNADFETCFANVWLFGKNIWLENLFCFLRSHLISTKGITFYVHYIISCTRGKQCPVITSGNGKLLGDDPWNTVFDGKLHKMRLSLI